MIEEDKKRFLKMFDACNNYNKEDTSITMKENNIESTCTEFDDTIENNNDSTESVTLTPAETIGRSSDLMSLIIKMLPRAKDRKNIRATCKFFYHLCSSKRFNWCSPQISHSRSVFEFVEDTLAVSIPSKHWNTMRFLENRKGIVTSNALYIKNLEIDAIDPVHMKYFEELNCFNSVECVTFDSENSMDAALNIFYSCPTLRPHTIKIAHLCQKKNLNDSGLFDIARMFPSSVRHVHFECNFAELYWLDYFAYRIPARQFETLHLNAFTFVSLRSNPVFLRKLLNISKCFKKIEISSIVTTTYEVARDLINSISIINVHKDTGLSFNTTIVLEKNNSAHFDPNTFEAIPDSINMDTVNSTLLKVNELHLACEYRWTNLPSEYISPFPVLVQKMKCLTTLELSVKALVSKESFKSTIRNLPNTLLNIKLYECSSLKESSLELLAASCGNIYYLSLDGVKCVYISLKKIPIIFKNLKGLSVNYMAHYKNLEVVTSFLEASKKTNYKITRWPKLDFLQVVLKKPKNRDKMIFEKIEKMTPRRCGRFLVKCYCEKYKINCEVLEIIIQKSTTCYETFTELFS
uniref:Cystatin domain-containing protein n=1 Tax=Strongyloides stercoralis TaxID=6248 RepID=A0A0K0EFY3_STRER